MYLALALFLCMTACAHLERPPEGLESARSRLERVEKEWRRSLDDPSLDSELEQAYLALQQLCRKLDASGGSMGLEQRETCDIVVPPYRYYRDQLLIERDDLTRDLFDMDTPGTLAAEYVRRPSQRNEDRLHELFDMVDKHLHPRVPWALYFQHPRFQESRLSHYLREFKEARGALLSVRSDSIAEPEESTRLSERRSFTFERLKREVRSNQGLEACRIGPLSRATTSEEYEKELVAEQEEMAARAAAGRRKEVVVFIHGLAGDRDDWKSFPELLSHEDMVSPDLDCYFRVYNYRYNTEDNNRRLDAFAQEFEAFLRSVAEHESVPSLNVIAHSQGGVLSLRALVNSARDPVARREGSTLEPGGKMASNTRNEASPDYGNGALSALALDAVAAFEASGPPLIKRLITAGTPYHGDEMANVLVQLSIPEPQRYHRFPSLPWRVPYFGTGQTRDIRMGAFHLASIEAVDMQWILQPVQALEYLEKGARSMVDETLEQRMRASEIPVMSIVALPENLPALAQLEDDGLVRAYAANLRHHYMWGPNATLDLGYQGAVVRIFNSNHALLRMVGDRNHPTYRQALAFLLGKPLIESGSRAVEKSRFQVLLRVFPSDLLEPEDLDAFFASEMREIALPGRQIALPPLEVDWEENETLKWGVETWNDKTGILGRPGNLATPNGSREIALTLRAEGYREKTIRIPVQAGQVTYAVHVTLESVGLGTGATER